MSGAVHTTLRAANHARQAEWDPNSKITLTYRMTELAGETGEACNIAKKLERERLGIRGSRATVDQLAEELADVVICADLVAMGMGIDLDEAVAAKFNATSEANGLTTQLASPEQRISVNFALSQDEVGARYGLATSTDRAAIAACRVWFTDLAEAWTYAALRGLTIWDLVEGRVVDARPAAADADDDDDVVTCGICNVPFKEGDDCYTDVDLGSVHAACCGPERESFVNLDTGEPLAEGEPIPAPWKWTDASPEAADV